MKLRIRKSYLLCAEKSFSQALGIEQKFSINYLTNTMQQLFAASIWWGVRLLHVWLLCSLSCLMHVSLHKINGLLFPSNFPFLLSPYFCHICINNLLLFVYVTMTMFVILGKAAPWYVAHGSKCFPMEVLALMNLLCSALPGCYCHSVLF